MPSGSLGRVCPRCAAAFLKAEPTEISGEPAVATRPFTPPQVAELAPLFSQLEILELIGQGGMGAVYKARQKELDRIVALKILPPGFGDAAFAERFAREAKALAKLNHPGIVTIYEFGRSNGLFFFLMEFVDGATLRQVLRGGRISPREALAIVPAICDALQYAHDQGIVHRDIKPENILLDRRGRIKVADFGLAKLMQSGGAAGEAFVPAAAPTATHASKVLGTPQYMAPEQVEHPAEVDHRADIYALGVVFYQMLTGELPAQLIEAPSNKVQIDVRLDEVVLRALEKKPELRFQQVSEIKTMVETIAKTHEAQAQHQKFETAPRFSRTALAGAAGAAIGFLSSVGSVLIQRYVDSAVPEIQRLENAGVSPGDPGWAVIRAWSNFVHINRYLVTPAMYAGMIAAAILGWMAVAQIRRSSGKIRGLGLAVCDGLFFLTLVPAVLVGRWALSLSADFAKAAVIHVASATAQKGDIGVRLQSLGTVDSSNSVTFAIAEDHCQEVIRKFDAHQVMTVEASNSKGEKFGHGFLSGVDNLIDTSTGTLKCKAALFPEGENLMVPGLFLNVSLLLETKHGVTLLPEADIQRDPQGAFVWEIQPDHTVTRRTVSVGTMDGGWTEIQSGLSPGDIVAGSEFNLLGEGRKVRFDVASQPPSAQPSTQPQEHFVKTIEWLDMQSLSGWISDLQNPDQKVQKMAERALTDLGTNDLPEFLKILSDTSDSSVEAGTLRYNTAQALKFMGPGIKSSLPAFAALLKSGRQASAYAGAEALAFTALAVPDAFSILTNGLTDPAAGVRDAATHGVELCLNTDSNSFAEPALPLLLRNLNDKADYIRADTVVALMAYAQRQRQSWRSPPRDAKPDLLIPPLIELLRDKYHYTREYAADALTSYGEGIKPWIPAIQKLLSDPDDGVRRSAARLLQGLNNSPTTNAIQNIGGTPTLSVQMNGTNPLSYQWIFNSSNAAGATNAAPK
jgi:serine/threonine protein kinase/HEAT repeat protein